MTTVGHMTREMFDTYIQALLKGEAEPVNDTVGYLAEKYREARIRYQVVGQTVSQLDRDLKAAREDLLRGEGVVNSYAADLEHFCGVEPRTEPAGRVVPPMQAKGEGHAPDNGNPKITAAGDSVTD